MSVLKGSGVDLVGLSVVVPKNREDNQELNLLSEKGKSEIINQVGIRYRHVAKDNLTASDLCCKAAENLLSKLGWSAEEVGLLVFVTQTPDHIVPGSATQIQHKLGMDFSSMALDINQGCAGYVYGMSALTGLMRAYKIPKAILLVGDTITKLVSDDDQALKPIFADAGSATAFELNEDAAEMNFELGSRGADYKAIYVPDGGFRSPNQDGIESANSLNMNGQAVFTFGLSTVATSITSLLDATSVKPDEIDFLVLHQANQLLNKSIVRKAGFNPNQAPSSLCDFGNTSCATIPVTLASQLSNQLQN
ncbi:MAG: ketoacyl-ACP synthase III, partial [Flavobacteriales bacterium]